MTSAGGNGGEQRGSYSKENGAEYRYALAGAGSKGRGAEVEKRVDQGCGGSDGERKMRSGAGGRGKQSEAEKTGDERVCRGSEREESCRGEQGDGEAERSGQDEAGAVQFDVDEQNAGREQEQSGVWGEVGDGVGLGSG